MVNLLVLLSCSTAALVPSNRDAQLDLLFEWRWVGETSCFNALSHSRGAHLLFVEPLRVGAVSARPRELAYGELPGEDAPKRANATIAWGPVADPLCG